MVGGKIKTTGFTEALTVLNQRLQELKNGLKWYDLATACELKGVNKNTLYAKPKYQPLYGKADAIICGKKRWHKETVREWLKQTDEDIPEVFR
jgi:hypothetical protein